MRNARQPFARLNRRLIASTLERYLPEQGAVLEIGMGDGQLRQLLPDALLSRLIHSEPDAALSRAYRRRHRHAKVIQATAEQLPLATASVAAVVGLCVLDVVTDPAAVARELRRVLRPGGRLLHWLDMTTVLDSVVDSLWSVGLVPFPNWLSDPSAREWPEDLVLVPREQLALVVSSLRAAGNPAAHPLNQYLATFASAPTAPGAPTRELIQLQESPRLRSVLSEAFRMAFELAAPDVRAQLAAFRAQPLSTAQHFEARLRGWFDEEAGFHVELSGLERAWETTPRQSSDLVYRSCLVGEQRHLPRLPRALLCADAASDPERETLTEAGIFSFVATRLET